MFSFYSSFKVLIKIALRLYFYRIRIEGLENIPKGIPLIVTPNHQNAFLDALLVGAFIPIPLNYITRQDVFVWWSKPLLKLLNMMPIYRIRDGYSTLSMNDTVFEACRGKFSEGGSVLIFAEGNHGRHYYLRPLTKGAARLALKSQAALEQKLTVLPVGLNYFNHQSPKSTVLIRFGKPVSVKEHVQAYSENQAKGLISMRDAISEGMKSTLVIPDETPDYEKISEATFREEHEGYSFDQLRSLDYEKVDLKSNRRAKKHRLARILNPLPFYLIHRVVNPIHDVVFHSSLKFGIGLFAFPLWWMIVFFTMSLLVGINIALLTVIVMVFGLFYSYQR